MNNSSSQASRKFYIVGGGIAGLATAVYLIREGGCAGQDITIFDGADVSGGALDGSGSAEEGYLPFHLSMTRRFRSKRRFLRLTGRSSLDHTHVFSRMVRRWTSLLMV